MTDIASVMFVSFRFIAGAQLAHTIRQKVRPTSVGSYENYRDLPPAALPPK